MPATFVVGKAKKQNTKKYLKQVFSNALHIVWKTTEGGGGEGGTRRCVVDDGRRNECNILLAVLVSVKFRIWTNFACFIGEVAAVPATAGMAMGMGYLSLYFFPLSLTCSTQIRVRVCPRLVRVRLGELRDTRKNRVLSELTRVKANDDEDEMSNMMMMLMMVMVRNPMMIMMSHCCCLFINTPRDSWVGIMYCTHATGSTSKIYVQLEILMPNNVWSWHALQIEIQSCR